MVDGRNAPQDGFELHEVFVLFHRGLLRAKIGQFELEGIALCAKVGRQFPLRFTR